MVLDLLRISKLNVMKHEWRKREKNIYLPKNQPDIIEVPTFKYLTVRGKGNPNSDLFTEYIGVLYSLSYAVKMSKKKGMEPKGFYDYTVYPLEGVWDINEEAKKSTDYHLNKDDLVFKLMIRQPDFVTEEFITRMKDMKRQEKPYSLLDEVCFETIKEGKCVQMLHVGSYDDEPESFEKMERFATDNGLTRSSKVHKEIYLSDARKVEAEKLKTVLRFKVDG